VRLHHFYHLYADGCWEVPALEHFDALRLSGLYAQLDTLHVGFVGSVENVAAAQDALRGYDFETCADMRDGFEQETLDRLWEFSHNNDGAVLYAHTKGAANYARINDAWRRSMTYHCVIRWEYAVEQIAAGKTIAGCHWIKGNPNIERLVEAWQNRHLNPPGLDGVGGMFGGNFWWTRLEDVRRNVKPTRVSRMDAEHWLGQLSEVMPIIKPGTICDLNPKPIHPQNLTDQWPSQVRREEPCETSR